MVSEDCDVPPQGPRGTDEFVNRFEPNTYQHWVVSRDVQKILGEYEDQVKQFNKEMSKYKNSKGAEMKLAAIQDLAVQLEKVEEALLSYGAKTFKELYPDIQDPEASQSHTSDEDNAPYNFKFDFKDVKDLTASRRDAYVRL